MAETPQAFHAFEPLSNLFQAIVDRLEQIEGTLRQVLAAEKPGQQPVRTKLLTTAEVAILLRVQEQTLRKWRLTQMKGPPWIVLDDERSVRYDEADVQRFLQSRKRQPVKFEDGKFVPIGS